MATRVLPALDMWHAPTLLNGWTDYGSGWAPTGYYLDQAGFVWLRGLVKSGTAANQFILNLPVAIRPLSAISVPGITAAGGGQILINQASGNVSYQSGGSTVWSSLSGVRYFLG